MAPSVKHPGIPKTEMVDIPAGPFLMGTSNQQVNQLARGDALAQKWMEKGYFKREQPQHIVTLAGYSIGKYPVTVGEYLIFWEAGGYQYPRYWTVAGWAWRQSLGKIQPEYWDDDKWSGDPRFPVVGVSWYEAMAYCRWLSELKQREYRLPTEAEWEKAARGTDGRLYPWGNTFDAKQCNTRASGLNQTMSVGMFAPRDVSPWGCSEMVGNVSEWTLSKFEPYEYDDNDGRNDEGGNSERVIRGGSWHSPVLRARTSTRGYNDPFFADNDVGFRIVEKD